MNPPAAVHTAYVALGANLGDPTTQIRQALRALTSLPQTQLLQHSSLYRSPPFAPPETPVETLGPDYINAVAALHTQLSPEALLSALQTVEHAAGRERSWRNAPRTLDLDLLLYDDLTLETPLLSLPHPRMWERAFVLLPLAEIAPALVSAEQLAALRHQNVVRVQNTERGIAST